jgi:hypothetical protein
MHICGAAGQALFLEFVTAVCLQPVSLSFTSPSRWRMLFTSFRVSSPPLLRPFLGRSKPSSWSFVALRFPGTQCSFDPKIVGGVFIFRLWKFGLFVLCFCIVVQYCVFFYFGVLWSEGHFWRPKVLYGLSMCCVCIVPMVSLLFIVRRVSDGENYDMWVYANLCWWELLFMSRRVSDGESCYS